VFLVAVCGPTQVTRHLVALSEDAICGPHHWRAGTRCMSRHKYV